MYSFDLTIPPKPYFDILHSCRIIWGHYSSISKTEAILAAIMDFSSGQVSISHQPKVVDIEPKQ